MTSKEMRYRLITLDGMKEELKELTIQIAEYKNMEIEVIMTKAPSHDPRIPGTGTSSVEYIAVQRCDRIMSMEQRRADLFYIIGVIHKVLFSLDSIDRYIIENLYINHVIGRRNPKMEKIVEDISKMNTDPDTGRIQYSITERQGWRRVKNVIRRLVEEYNKNLQKKSPG